MSTLPSENITLITKVRTACFYAAIVIVFLSFVGIFSRGLNLGLDFTGGYLTEFSTDQSVSQKQMQTALAPYLSEDFKLSSAENGSHWSVRQVDKPKANADIIPAEQITKKTSEQSIESATSATTSTIANSDINKDWLTTFAQQSTLDVTPLDAIYIGSQVGDELINQGGLALMASIIVILFYLSLRFEWRLAMGAVVALFHDVVVVLGLFSWFGISFDLTILASLLAIIGYSLNDSIIVGDKIRELMKNNNDDKHIDTIINLALKSTWVRTMITSGTTLATVLAIWLFAGESLNGFSIALFTGIVVGTFSSIAISATVPKLLGLTADYYQNKEEDICQLP